MDAKSFKACGLHLLFHYFVSITLMYCAHLLNLFDVVRMKREEKSVVYLVKAIFLPVTTKEWRHLRRIGTPCVAPPRTIDDSFYSRGRQCNPRCQKHSQSKCNFFRFSGRGAQTKHCQVVVSKRCQTPRESDRKRPLAMVLNWMQAPVETQKELQLQVHYVSIEALLN